MEALLTATRGKTSRIVKNAALPIGHLQPDFVIDDGFGDLVITVPWRVDRSYSLKLTKYLPLLQRGRAAFFLPIVVGGDGTLHPATASGSICCASDWRLRRYCSGTMLRLPLRTPNSLPMALCPVQRQAPAALLHRVRMVGDFPTPQLQTPSVEVVDSPPEAPRPRAGTPTALPTAHAAPVRPRTEEEAPPSATCTDAPASEPGPPGRAYIHPGKRAPSQAAPAYFQDRRDAERDPKEGRVLPLQKDRPTSRWGRSRVR
ncbi:Hypothetical protein GSB_154589 [Giardia duodenalis]|uniref:Uncharacterized protein n=1 Tax=Giardia intestinalis TaxID=5741 RepID=V6TMZ2_GIAIN|nr:Hypothetical protein GSB_154589 [Giardia intestinalis]